jgi:hypothetical protein
MIAQMPIRTYRRRRAPTKRMPAVVSTSYQGTSLGPLGYRLDELYGGFESGSWLTTTLPANRAINTAGTPAAVAEIQRQITTYTPWISGSYSASWTSTLNVVPADQPLVPVTLVGDRVGQGYAQALIETLANGLPLPPGLTAPPDADAEVTVIQPDWVRPGGGYGYTGRLYELWVTKDPSQSGGLGWTAYWGGRMVDVMARKNGHWSDWWWGDAGVDSWGANGVAEDHNWGAQATSIPLVGTIISLRDIQRGIIKHPIGLLMNGADGTHPQAGPVWPAQRWDGASVDVLRQGSRLRLPANWVVNTSHHIFTQMLEVAARDYGFVFTDTSAGVAVRMEPGDWTPWMSVFNPSQVMRDFPWGSLQLLTVGSDSNQNPVA